MKSAMDVACAFPIARKVRCRSSMAKPGLLATFYATVLGLV